jgi:hypothetical protein
MDGGPMDIHKLKKGSQYRVRQNFADYYHNQFTEGERLTFLESHFLPYHGGYTVVFEEKILYLQEEANSNILSALRDYLSIATE